MTSLSDFDKLRLGLTPVVDSRQNEDLLRAAKNKVLNTIALEYISDEDHTTCKTLCESIYRDVVKLNADWRNQVDQVLKSLYEKNTNDWEPLRTTLKSFNKVNRIVADIINTMSLDITTNASGNLEQSYKEKLLRRKNGKYLDVSPYIKQLQTIKTRIDDGMKSKIKS